MGWEKRGENRYYYRKYRLGRKVKSVYLGSGSSGFQAETEDQLARQQRQKEKQMNDQLMVIFHHLEAIDQQVGISEHWAKLIYESMLIGAGYHQHHRQWRKKRCRQQ